MEEKKYIYKTKEDRDTLLKLYRTILSLYDSVLTEEVCKYAIDEAKIAFKVFQNEI